MEYASYFFFNLIFGLQKYLNKKFSDGLIYKLGKKIIGNFLYLFIKTSRNLLHPLSINQLGYCYMPLCVVNAETIL